MLAKVLAKKRGTCGLYVPTTWVVYGIYIINGSRQMLLKIFRIHATKTEAAQQEKRQRQQVSAEPPHAHCPVYIDMSTPLLPTSTRSPNTAPTSRRGRRQANHTTATFLNPKLPRSKCANPRPSRDRGNCSKFLSDQLSGTKKKHNAEACLARARVILGLQMRR